MSPFSEILDLECEKAKAIIWKFGSYIVYHVEKASLQWERRMKLMIKEK